MGFLPSGGRVRDVKGLDRHLRRETLLTHDSPKRWVGRKNGCLPATGQAVGAVDDGFAAGLAEGGLEVVSRGRRVVVPPVVGPAVTQR